VNDLLARLSAFAYAGILIAAVGTLYVTSQPSLRSGTEVHAEFQDVYPLLTGMNVREWGAPAGSVSDIELTDDGTVMVTLQLNAGTTPPRADATASIREQDITGDSYVDLSPGHASQPLGDGVIPPTRTLVAPRFDDLLNSFDKPVQQSLQILLDQLGLAVQGRGQDVNRAVLKLRPALAAADQALSEVDSQNRTLRALIGDTEKITSQAAGGAGDLGRLVDSLAKVTETTAAHSAGLDSSLQIAPQTLSRARTTLARLAGLARAGLPVARTLRDAAPQLAKTATLLGPFLDDASAVLADVSPTLALTRKLFVASEPTLQAAPKRVFTAPFDVASGTGKLLSTLLGQKDIIRSLFGAEGYGRAPKNDGAVGLGAVAVERGNQSDYPAGYDRKRFFLRASTVLSCESFGLRIEPGCLTTLLGGGVPSPSPSPHGHPASHHSSSGPAGSGTGAAPPGPSRPSAGPADGVLGGADRILHNLGDTVHKPKPPPSNGALNDLLHVILGP
jgi:phospholipid/cholesterol/gamma-HCH transport system substrate-binding protein